ncbi:MAG: HAMP domain-containing sensor histidine kinase [Betaproteobacteria bacterium]
MLQLFLIARRSELILRCRQKVIVRTSAEFAASAPQHGIPIFLDQLIQTLGVEHAGKQRASEAISGDADGATAATSEIGASAALHGHELLLAGYSVEQLVHDYGDLCQAITDLAYEENVEISVDEFRTLNRCLDNAIAIAVTEFSSSRDAVLADKQLLALNERQGFIAHEQRNLLNSAMLSVAALKTGRVGITGALGGVLERSLEGLRVLIDRSLSEVRMSSGLQTRPERFSVADFIAELRHSASLQATARNCRLLVAVVDAGLFVTADRAMMLGAVNNLLQNAFKFTCLNSDVTLTAFSVLDRVHIDVKDHCGGLPEDSERLFRPFTQDGTDRTGLGLGLSIARQSVEANGGTLSVRNIPGSGCVFTVNVPLASNAEFTPAKV